MNPNLLVLSHATYVGASGATAAATYSFVTKNYKLPAETRDLDFDIVHNQNGKFKYVYDNGPGFRRWSPITIRCEDAFQSILGANALTQYQHILEMWHHRGILGMSIAGNTYNVHWSQEPISPGMIVFPKEVGDAVETEVVLQFEEA